MKPAFVLDASLALAWCFQDEATPYTRELLERMANESALVSGWWFIELTNVLAIAERKKRIALEKMVEFMALIETLDLAIDHEAPDRAFTDILPLCRTHQLSSYDAIYLELALRQKLPLATLDEPLQKAARKAGVEIIKTK